MVDWFQKEPRTKVPVEEVELHPALSREEARAKWLNRRLKQKGFKYNPEKSTYYFTPDGKAKILFLRRVLDPDYYKQAYAAVQKIDYQLAKYSKRACLKGSPGGDCLFGYNDKLIPRPDGTRQKHPEWTAESVKQFPRFRALWPLCYDMQDLLGLYLPDYWQGREIGDPYGPAPRSATERNEFFKVPAEYQKFVEHFDQAWLFYSIPGSNFSTMTVNWNTIFRAHQDVRNSSGALSCMAVFGTFEGGELCFPRLGVAVNAQELDLVICDCPLELHATLTQPWGTRFSVVAYTKEGLTSAGRRKKKSAISL
jgi:hypothetical protein